MPLTPFAATAERAPKVATAASASASAATAAATPASAPVQLWSDPSPPARITLAELFKDPPLDQLHHTSWGPREGLIGMVIALAQTSDGYLWLGTDRGLLRFDGVRFEPFESLAGEALVGRAVLSLQPAPDNGLWVGFLRGGLALVRDGRVVLEEKPAPGGLEGATRAFVQEKDGTVWVAATRGFFKRVGDRWQRVGKAEGYPEQPSALTMGARLDGEGNVWAEGNAGVFVKRAGQSRFVAVPTPGKDPIQLTVDPQGRMWVSGRFPEPIGMSRRRFFRLPRPGVPGDAVDTGHPALAGQYMPFFDRRGDLWFGALDGVARQRLTEPAGPLTQVLPPEAASAPPVPMVPFVPASAASVPGALQAYTVGVPAVQRLTPSHRLSGEQVLQVLQDREGSIWIGTNGGLDRLRSTRVSLMRFPMGASTMAMAAGPHGDLWFTSRNGILHLDTADSRSDLVSYPLLSVSVSRVFVGPTGIVWLGDRNGLIRLGPDGQYVRERPDSIPDWSGTIKDLAEDRDGTLWIASQFMGLLRRFSDGRWERLGAAQGFPASGSPSVTTVDGRGRVWLGYNDGQLIRVDDGGRLTRFGEKEGVRVGGILSITPREGYLWIGGDRGVQRLDDAGFHDVRAASADALNGVSGLVETPSGDLWLNGAAGITRIEAADVRRALGDPAFRAPLMQLDTSDGLPGRAETSFPLRTALQTPDGRLWFTLTSGVVTVDPATVARITAPSQIDIQRVMVGGERVAPQADGTVLTLAGTRDLQVDYASLSLAMPERARFKYRLSGLETAWHDAVTRRQAFYTNLGPGRYVFEVQATNADGVWNAKAATLGIEIPPTFVQSAGFRVLCALAVLMLVVLLARWRLRQVEARALERYRARLEERTRIAQDLHDTLLQGFQGLLLRFQRVAWGIPEALPARAEMERVLDQADEVVVDGRHRVTDLRQPPSNAAALERTLEALGADLAEYHDQTVRVAVDGVSRPLEDCVRAELALVAREGLFNALRHSKGSCVEVKLGYGDAAFTLAIEDNGVGVPTEIQAEGQRPGHWGLSGMRERVTSVGGSFALRSAPGEGTGILVSIPAAKAYPQAAEPVRFPRLRRWLGALMGTAPVGRTAG